MSRDATTTDLVMEHNKLLMYLFVASDVIFFTLLILAYLNFHGQSGFSEEAKRGLTPWATLVFSAFLWSSSFFMWLAVHSLAHGRRILFRLAMLATIAFGITFLAGEGVEWAHLYGRGVTIDSGMFGTTFFPLTGFHGLHVIAGLVTLSIMLGLGIAGDFDRDIAPLEAVSIYWHFVDVVWIAIFGVVYLEVLR